jgi:hypothetical protein
LFAVADFKFYNGIHSPSSVVSAMANLRNESTPREVEMARVLQELQGTIHFVIDRLGKSQVPENTVSETCRLVG